jgi:hypothetical protein
VHAVTSSLLYVLPAAVTAAVAIAGFSHASSLSRRVQQAEEKRWKVDRKADAYKRAVEYLLYRKQDRIAWLNKVQLGTASKKALRKAIAEFDQAGWIAMNARLMLYAADPVRDAVEAGNVAHNDVMRLGHEWNRWLDDIRKIIEADGPQAVPTGLVDVEIEAKERMMLALKAAFRAESALIEVLQSDMSGPRPAAAAWPGICGPATRSFFPAAGMAAPLKPSATVRYPHWVPPRRRRQRWPARAPPWPGTGAGRPRAAARGRARRPHSGPCAVRPVSPRPESLALRWRDIGLEEGTISVRRSAGMVGGRRARPVTVTDPHGGTELRSAWVRPGNARTIVSCIVANASMFRREVLIAHA